MRPPLTADVIVIGAGAAGLACAIEAGRRGRRVLVLERNAEPGRKILISGGGRCNFTNVGTTPERFLSGNPRFAVSALARYTPADVVARIERHGVAYHEKKLGQLFCGGSARQVVRMLTDESREAGVTIRCGVEVNAVERSGSGFAVTADGRTLACRALVVASGGLSIPKLGATDFAHRLAARFGVPVAEPRPGLVPFRFAGEERAFCAELAGISLDVVTRCGPASVRENLRFTHRGLSGPALLQASSYWEPGRELVLDLLPDESAESVLGEARERGRTLRQVLAQRQPHRFARRFAEHFGPQRPLAELSKRELSRLAGTLGAWRLRPTGTEGYAKAEVTVGGVDTDALSSKSFECREIPGLHFVGEALDVTGWLGGYNFQWAWASGVAAGRSV
jgi:predicted Rossmann fold flavoprotein